MAVPRVVLLAESHCYSTNMERKRIDSFTWNDHNICFFLSSTLDQKVNKIAKQERIKMIAGLA